MKKYLSCAIKMFKMRYFLALASCVLLLFSFPLLCGAQEPDSAEDLSLKTGKRITPSLRGVLPFYVGASVPVDVPLGQSAAFSFGVEAVGLRLSARSCPVEATTALRFSGMCFQPGRNVFYLGIPLRVAGRIGRACKVYAGASAEMSLGKSQDFSRFLGEVEGGVSFYGFGLRASYTVTPFSGGSRAVSLGLIIGL